MKKKNEYFVVSVEDTKRYGLISASIIGRLRWWCEYNEKNKVKDRHHQDYWWSGFISARELAEQLGLSESTTEKNLTKLLKTGVLIKGVFNKKGFDRTGWYRVNPSTLTGETIPPNETQHTTLKDKSIPPNRVNGTTSTGGTIPVSPPVKQNVKQTGSHSVNPPVNPSVELSVEDKQNVIPVIKSSKAPEWIIELLLTLITGGLNDLTKLNKEELKSNKHFFNKIGVIQPILNQL
jgi:DNA-binding transcriptional ArsR family regulator